MPRYIDADAVNKVFIDELGKIPSVVIDERIEWYIECDATKQTIIRCAKGVSAIPTAGVVARKHGKWKHGYCSECGYNWGKDAPFTNVPNYCPNCGVEMREVE